MLKVFVALLLIVHSAWSASKAHSQTLHLNNKVIYRTSLQAISADGTVQFSIAASAGNGKSGEPVDEQSDAEAQDSHNEAGRLDVPISQVVSWGGLQSLAAAAVWLDDGSWLAGSVSLEDEQVVVVNEWLNRQAVSYRQIRGMVLHPPRSPAEQASLLQDMEQTAGDRDVLWFRDGRKISGIITPEPNSDGSRGFRLVDGSGTTAAEAWIGTDEIAGVAFSPALLSPLAKGAGSTIIGLADGTRLNLERLVASEKQVEIQTRGGLTISSIDTVGEFSKQVTYLAAQSSDGLLLQDIEPVQYKQLKPSMLVWELGRGVTASGGRLKDNFGWLQRGLGQHSSSQVAYRLPSDVDRFLCELCFAKQSTEAESVSGNDVICEILILRDKELVKVAEHRLARLDSVVVDVDVAASQLLVLIVREGRMGAYGDDVQWLAARLTSTQPEMKR